MSVRDISTVGYPIFLVALMIKTIFLQRFCVLDRRWELYYLLDPTFRFDKIIILSSKTKKIVLFNIHYVKTYVLYAYLCCSVVYRKINISILNEEVNVFVQSCTSEFLKTESSCTNQEIKYTKLRKAILCPLRN